MNFTQEEAASIVLMVSARQKAEADAMMPVLAKIAQAYPDLLENTVLGGRVTEYVQKSALQRISEHLDEARAAIRKAQQVSDDTGVGFDFSMDPDRTTYYEPNEGWRASDWC